MIKRYTYSDTLIWVQSILNQMREDQFFPEYVVGITRGGLIPAVLISQYLDLPMKTIHISLRGDQPTTENNVEIIEDAVGLHSAPKNILIVDDINHTGATFDWIKNDWPTRCKPDNSKRRWDSVWNKNVKFAALVENESSMFRDVDYYGEFLTKDEGISWPMFAWERWWE